jgi:flagellar motility protein MotE (MotC chaperone)
MEMSGSPKLAMNRIPVRCAGLVLALAACVAPVSLGHAQDAPMTGQPLDLRPRPPAPRKKPKPASHHAKPAEAPARYMALPAEPAAKPAAADKTEAPAAAKAPSKDEAAPQPAPTEAAKPEHAEAPGPAPARSVAQDYCMNVADVASQALVAWQAKRLAELEDQIKIRIDELDAKRAEYQQWSAQQQEARRRTEEGIVAIFAKMRPDAAAQQLAAMEEGSAVAVLTRLNPRAAGTILNEMTAAKAARLTDAMTRVALAARNP